MAYIRFFDIKNAFLVCSTLFRDIQFKTKVYVKLNLDMGYVNLVLNQIRLLFNKHLPSQKWKKSIFEKILQLRVFNKHFKIEIYI